jgi:hypothetical protein
VKVSEGTVCKQLEGATLPLTTAQRAEDEDERESGRRQRPLWLSFFRGAGGRKKEKKRKEKKSK